MLYSTSFVSLEGVAAVLIILHPPEQKGDTIVEEHDDDGGGVKEGPKLVGPLLTTTKELLRGS